MFGWLVRFIAVVDPEPISRAILTAVAVALSVKAADDAYEWAKKKTK